MFGFVQGYLGGSGKRSSSNPSVPPQDVTSTRHSSRFSTQRAPSLADTRPPTRQASVRTHSQSHAEEYVTVLVLGRSRSGKTTFINNAFSKPKTGRSIAEPSGTKPTADVVSVRITTSKQKFKLIDTPGFDNPEITNLEAFSKLANYLSIQSRMQTKVRGIVYIHPVGDFLESRTLAQNMHVISELFLGEAGLSRLSILVVPSHIGSLDSASVAQALPLSAAFRPACDKGAKVLVSSLDSGDINNLILSYVPQEPILLRIQQAGIRRSPTELRNQIEEHLGYYEKDSLKRLAEEEAQARLAPYKSQIHSLEETLKESQEQVSRLTESQQAQLQPESTQEDSALRQQLEETQHENVSLRSQLQLGDSVKLEDTIKSLGDLNRKIEELSRTVSAYLVDKYVQKVLGRDPGDVTALHGRHLTELASLFGHVEGNSSLMSSSTGAGMPIEDFLDYAIRSMLCKHICKRIFDPFHPGVDISQSDVMSRIYSNMRKRETQVVAGRWRAEAFKSMYKDNNPDVASNHIKTIAQKVQRDSINAITSHFFGQKTEIKLESQHLEQLEALVRTAWDWNAVLKGEVALQGDLYPIAYPPSSRYDPKLMAELEQSPRKLLPRSILATLALGLVSFRAVGGERSSEMTVVAKALVATKTVYT